MKPPPAQRHSPTSAAAADEISPSISRLQRVLLESLRADGPATDEALAARVGLSGDTERPRRVELVRAGLVGEVGEGRTSSGRRAVLWGAVVS